ncbi:acyltransferase family protein [Paeniroseomonas aquatica]|uniref:Acyltransferase n=1 Tax=Paeniroseomonas aquatica TaxID=373043 RepID=A0ABT8AGE7_9PROT|nr:acyltransferase [Paeniroseomonas aquatica]MDN3568881.1 acyltransferase [Paeniroseomonas aquatica]
MQQKRNDIQWLRALAAIEVVVWHTDLVTKHFSAANIAGSFYERFGGFGVELFFIISGYVIALTAPRHATGAGFMLARLARLIPLYWSATALVFLAALLNPDWSQGSLDFRPEVIAKSLAFWPQQQVPVMALGWSLEHEMLFYGLAALWLGGGGRARAAWAMPALLAGLGTLGFFLGTGLAQRVWDLHLASPYMLAFGFGWLFRLAETAAGRRRLGLLALPPAMVALLAVLPIRPEEGLLLLRLAVAVALFLAALGLRRLLERPGPTNALMGRVGDASYSIYLSHWFVLSILGKLLGPLDPADGFDALLRLLAVLLCMAVGVAVFTQAEAPIDRALKRRLGAWEAGRARRRALRPASGLARAAPA